MNSLSTDVSRNKLGNSFPEAKTIVSVVIPIRNEESYISECLDSVLRQDYPKEQLEVNLIDGMSDDRTVEIINKYAKQYPFFKLYQNPQITVPCAINIGIRNAKGEYVIRLDAHAEYASDYISKCVEYLEKTGASNVGGPAIAVGEANTQKAIAAAYHSPFAMGGGKYHQEGYEGYADTVWPGAFRKSTLLGIGMYDESFDRSEDDELNYRIINSGGKIYITPEIKCRYFPRKNLAELLKQYYEYGLWKPAVIKKHGKPARLSHLAPMSFVLFLILFGIGSLFSKTVAYLYFSVMIIYLLLVLIFSFSSKYAENIHIKLLLCVVHIALHISYGIGFIIGIFKFRLLNKEFK